MNDPKEPNSTSSHPPHSAPDPTESHPPSLENRDQQQQQHVSTTQDSGNTASATARPAELSSLTMRLRKSLRQFQDFPEPGILFEDIMPLFADHALHSSLIHALELLIKREVGHVDVIVGLEARGFLFGPSLALRLGAGFVPVRKQGKLPGDCETAGFQKEYGQDYFQVQKGVGIKKGQRVLVVDDIIATGGSAAAAGSLVKFLDGQLLGYVFLLELEFLKGREKLEAPVYTLLTGQQSRPPNGPEKAEMTGNPLLAL
ncbi:MAG: adenine phosphoribosyltransferase [Pycnora praestabilis]|nr:MAG: adenine phosphoribosyltransferase [Pycnora praestabilis]